MNKDSGERALVEHLVVRDVSKVLSSCVAAGVLQCV